MKYYIGLDAHIYKNHIDQINTQLKRVPLDLPYLKLNEKIKDIDSFTVNDIELVNYQHHGVIKGKVST